MLASCRNAGRVERLLHRFYAANRLNISTFTEFFALDNEDVGVLAKDMKAMNCHQYTPPETHIQQAPQSPGRKKKTNAEILAEHQDIVTCLRKGMGIRETARETQCGVNTVQRIKKALRETYPDTP